MCSNYEPVTLNDRFMAHFGVVRSDDLMTRELAAKKRRQKAKKAKPAEPLGPTTGDLFLRDIRRHFKNALISCDTRGKQAES